MRGGGEGERDREGDGGRDRGGEGGREALVHTDLGRSMVRTGDSDSDRRRRPESESATQTGGRIRVSPAHPRPEISGDFRRGRRDPERFGEIRRDSERSGELRSARPEPPAHLGLGDDEVERGRGRRGEGEGEKEGRRDGGRASPHTRPPPAHLGLGDDEVEREGASRRGERGGEASGSAMTKSKRSPAPGGCP